MSFASTRRTNLASSVSSRSKPQRDQSAEHVRREIAVDVCQKQVLVDARLEILLLEVLDGGVLQAVEERRLEPLRPLVRRLGVEHVVLEME